MRMSSSPRLADVDKEVAKIGIVRGNEPEALARQRQAELSCLQAPTRNCLLLKPGGHQTCGHLSSWHQSPAELLHCSHSCHKNANGTDEVASEIINSAGPLNIESTRCFLHQCNSNRALSYAPSCPRLLGSAQLKTATPQVKTTCPECFCILLAAECSLPLRAHPFNLKPIHTESHCRGPSAFQKAAAGGKN